MKCSRSAFATAALIACAIALLAPGLARSQTCTGVNISYSIAPTYIGSPNWFSTDTIPNRAIACEAFISQHGVTIAQAQWVTDASDGIPTYTSWAAVRNGTSACSVLISAQRTSSPAGPVSTTFSASISVTGGVCEPPPPECDAEFPGAGEDTFTSTVAPSSSGYCNALSNCKMKATQSVNAGGTTVYTIAHTTENCDSGAPPPGPEDLEDGESCSTGSGAEFCISKEGENCGYLNGGFVCLEQTEQDGCQVFEDGGRVCGAEAPTPPVPDDGNPGVPAPPDQVITTTVNNTTNVYNYYNPTTVGNSDRPPGSSGDNPFDGEDDGSGDEDEPGESGAGGEGTDDDGCTEADGCTGTLPTIGEVGDCETFLACLSAYWARIGAAPIVASVTGAAAALPSGSCPTVNITMFGESNSLSAPMCEIWSATIAPIIGGVFMILYAWIATRTVLSA